jgi:hydrogenase expression/formation protein HypE
VARLIDETSDKLESNRVMIAHGGGGELMRQLIRDCILPPIRNEELARLADGAVLPWPEENVVFTTDSYVVTPVEFPGGDIGCLAVAGTVNDLAVMGAVPVALSLSFILEEGLSLDVLARVMRSISDTARQASAPVVTGDTKVIDRRSSVGLVGDGLFINTAGVGRRDPNLMLGADRIAAGDRVLINGPIAEHGLAVMSVRDGIEFETELRSDCAPLNGLISRLLETHADVKFMRDATRGGLAGVLADISESSGWSIIIDEASLPISSTARHAAEMMGLDSLTVANEGKVVCVVSAGDEKRAIEAMRGHEFGRHAVCIGTVTEGRPPLVELETQTGGRRIVQRPYGEELPRIC